MQPHWQCQTPGTAVALQLAVALAVISTVVHSQLTYSSLSRLSASRRELLEFVPP